MRGPEEGGFFGTTREGVESPSIEHARSGHDFGDAELVWRCMGCGEMGRTAERLPGTCTNGGTEEEALMYSTEDRAVQHPTFRVSPYRSTPSSETGGESAGLGLATRDPETVPEPVRGLPVGSDATAP